MIQQSVKTKLHQQVIVLCLLNLNQNLRTAGIFGCLLKEEWRQSHPIWICCSQQEKPEKDSEDTPVPKDKIWGFIHTTSTWHEGPSRTCTGASSSRCGNTRLQDQPNTQGRWLLLFHNPQGLEDSQNFRAEVNSIDFMFSWYLVRVCISQEQKTTEVLTTEQFNFVMRYFSLLPHRNPAVLWFKNSRELETRHFYKNQKKI